MPSLNRDFLSLLQDDFTKYPSFIETGTLEGETIFAMEPHFTKLYTIELSSHYHENTKNAYTGQKISFLEGDSSLVFPDFLPTIIRRLYFSLTATGARAILHGGASIALWWKKSPILRTCSSSRPSLSSTMPGCLGSMKQAGS